MRIKKEEDIIPAVQKLWKELITPELCAWLFDAVPCRINRMLKADESRIRDSLSWLIYCSLLLVLIIFRSPHCPQFFLVNVLIQFRLKFICWLVDWLLSFRANKWIKFCREIKPNPRASTPRPLNGFLRRLSCSYYARYMSSKKCTRWLASKLILHSV